MPSLQANHERAFPNSLACLVFAVAKERFFLFGYLGGLGGGSFGIYQKMGVYFGGSALDHKHDPIQEVPNINCRRNHAQIDTNMLQD